MNLVQGTLEMLVLRTLVFGPLHGYGISKALHSNSKEALDIEFGSLYPALKRLEAKGWVSANWDISETNRKAKYYRLTTSGRKQLLKSSHKTEPAPRGVRGNSSSVWSRAPRPFALQREHSKWAEFVAVVAEIMGPVSEGGQP